MNNIEFPYENEPVLEDVSAHGHIVNKYLDEWIEKITDITEYVNELKLLLNDKKDISELLPKERSYSVFFI